MESADAANYQRWYDLTPTQTQTPTPTQTQTQTQTKSTSDLSLAMFLFLALALTDSELAPERSCAASSEVRNITTHHAVVAPQLALVMKIHRETPQPIMP